MSAIDLGNLQGKLLVFGGPYSNFQATYAMRNVAESLGIAPDHCLCTGDIVAYCAQPKETVQLIRDWGIHCLMGNCEESFAENKNDCGCGFEEGTQCDLLSAQWFTYSNQHLGESERQWFADLPRKITFQFHHLAVEVVHGSVSSINRFMFHSLPDEDFRQEINQSNADVILAGHSGLPFTKKIDNRYWHNSGVIGMPANDGQTNTWYSILDVNDEGDLVIENKSLHYDYAKAYDAMQTSGLSNGYAHGLQSGLWPSLDVLPAFERQQQGQALKESKEIYK